MSVRLTAILTALWISLPAQAERADRPNVIVIMADDIGEKQNVLKANPDIVRRLQNHLQTFTNDISKNSRPAAFLENAKPLSK